MTGYARPEPTVQAFCRAISFCMPLSARVLDVSDIVEQSFQRDQPVAESQPNPET